MPWMKHTVRCSSGFSPGASEQPHRIVPKRSHSYLNSVSSNWNDVVYPTFENQKRDPVVSYVIRKSLCFNPWEEGSLRWPDAAPPLVCPVLFPCSCSSCLTKTDSSAHGAKHLFYFIAGIHHDSWIKNKMATHLKIELAEANFFFFFNLLLTE